mgnify:CR=1 FL=1
MKASEIPVGHLCYNIQLDKYGVVCFPHKDSDIDENVVVWLHNFCAAPVSTLNDYNNDSYEDLGPAPQFNITHREVVKTVVKVEVVPN